MTWPKFSFQLERKNGMKMDVRDTHQTTAKRGWSSSHPDFAADIFSSTPPCLKITQNVGLEFLNFGIFHQFLSYQN